MMQARTCGAFWDLSEKIHFMIGKNVFGMFGSFTHISISIRSEDSFLITLSGDVTTYLLWSVYFKSKMWIFIIFG